MCGILFHRGAADVTADAVYARALSCMNHRGPDHSATLRGRDYVIGHTRLAIIDPSPEANQPFVDGSGRYVIVLNGEIYNYAELRQELVGRGVRLRTRSDTEALLEYIIRFGLEKTLDRARGMFAFVLHDTVDDKSIAVRDHFGQKPLYYVDDGRQLIIASDIRSIIDLQGRPEPNVESYHTYLATRGIVHPRETFFVGVRAVPAGHVLRSDGKSTTTHEYFAAWELYDHAEAEQAASLDMDEAVERLEFFVRQAIARHLVSDVPVGVLLSGGIDSTLVYWYAHAANNRLTSLTKITPGIEEIPQSVVPRILAARASNAYFGLERPEYYLLGLRRFIVHSNAPSRWGGGPPMARLCSAARRLGVYVLLGGDCTDEYFAGYTTYGQRFKGFDGDPGRLGELVDVRRDHPWYSSKQCAGFEDYQLSVRRRILYNVKAVADDYERFVQASLLHDTSVFLQSCNLPHSDAFSMMASVELRNPMLDVDLVRFVVNLPARLKYAPGRGVDSHKHLLRQLAVRRIGDFVNVPKEGTRNYSMLISEPRYWRPESFLVSTMLGLPWPSERSDLFKLINLELFHRAYFVSEEDAWSQLLTPDGAARLLPGHSAWGETC